jgi:hypothetical protein
MAKIMAVLIVLVSNMALGDVTSLTEDKPITVTTGTRTGFVYDAITGKPIEDAVVVCNWDIRDFSLEGGSTRFGAVYETVTNKDGKYMIPSQSIDIENSLFSRLDPEQVFVYKFDYVWYWMFDKEIMPFIVYISNMPHIYRKQKNIVELQPWKNEMSHVEHMRFLPSYQLPMNKLKLLPEALAKEKILVNKEKKANASFIKDVSDAKKQLVADTDAYRKKQLGRKEYIDRLHNYLSISDADIVKSVSTALNDCNDIAAIPALIEFVKKNAYRRNSFEDVFHCLRSAINNPVIIYPAIASDRKKLITEIENWWEQNKGKNPADWESDDLTKLSILLAGQANIWKPLYDISEEFRLISGEVEDINNSPVMTVFKRFKTALLMNDPNTVRACFSDGIGQAEAIALLKLRPKFREIADGLKRMCMESENEYKAKYFLLSPDPEREGKRVAFPVHFVRDEMGNWKISRFYEYIKQNKFGK